MDTKKSVRNIILGLSLSYLYGGITTKHRIFPYSYLEAIKNYTVARINIKPFPNLSRTEYYYDKISFFEKHGKTYDVVMIGDSITDRAEWQDLFPHLKIANRGINGDTTDGVIDRLNTIVSTKAKKAFILIGVNDFSRGYSVSHVLRNYITIIDKLYACGIQPYIQSTLLTGKSKKELNRKINKLNECLQQVAKANDIIYIDLNEKLAYSGFLDGNYTKDGLHLSGDGYGVWRNVITPYIEY
jgi:lysophospholipase L1-like esterase